MYGFIHRALADLVMKRFGEDKWNEILLSSGIDLQGGAFLMHRVYTDRETFKLMSASSNVLGLEYDACLEAFGGHFVRYCKASGYERILRVLGRNLLEFLSNLDALHDHLATSYPGMRAPSFRCCNGANNNLILHYHSVRKGLYPIVVGLVKYVAKEFFRTDVDLILINKWNDNQIIFSIEPKDKSISFSFVNNNVGLTEVSSNPCDLKMRTKTFCDTFPFHVVFDNQLRIIQLGDGLRRMTLFEKQNKSLYMRDLFTIVRPVVEFTFEALVRYNSSVFVLSPLIGGAVADQTIRLKGQMIYIKETDMLLFVSSPRAAKLADFAKCNLRLSDLKLHDSTRDIIEMYETRPVVTRLMEQLEESSDNLRKLQVQLREDQKQTEALLNSIFPSSLVAKLSLNESVEAKSYKVATILFSDIVGFTALCGDDLVYPMDIIRLLDELYTKLDTLCDMNDVFKVETIGDAYTVAGGVPDYVTTHADQVVNMAAGVCEITKHVNLPIYGQHVRMRIGVHSGPCIAGVVGKKMLRYCLFGNSVNVANTMEKCCMPGGINISEATKRCLTNISNYEFVENLARPDDACKCFYVTLTSFRRQKLLSHMNSLGLMDTKQAGTMLMQSPPNNLSACVATDDKIISARLRRLSGSEFHKCRQLLTQISLGASTMQADSKSSQQQFLTVESSDWSTMSEEKGVKEVEDMEERRKLSRNPLLQRSYNIPSRAENPEEKKRTRKFAVVALQSSQWKRSELTPPEGEKDMAAVVNLGDTDDEDEKQDSASSTLLSKLPVKRRFDPGMETFASLHSTSLQETSPDDVFLETNVSIVCIKPVLNWISRDTNS